MGRDDGGFLLVILIELREGREDIVPHWPTAPLGKRVDEPLVVDTGAGKGEMNDLLEARGKLILRGEGENDDVGVLDLLGDPPATSLRVS